MKLMGDGDGGHVLDQGPCEHDHACMWGSPHMLVKYWFTSYQESLPHTSSSHEPFTLGRTACLILIGDGDSDQGPREHVYACMGGSPLVLGRRGD